MLRGGRLAIGDDEARKRGEERPPIVSCRRNRAEQTHSQQQHACTARRTYHLVVDGLAGKQWDCTTHDDEAARLLAFSVVGQRLKSEKRPCSLSRRLIDRHADCVSETSKTLV